MLESERPPDGDNSWLIATCPNCSKQIKAKKEILKSALSIACPYCQYSLNLREENLNIISKPKYSKAEIQKVAPEKGPRKRKNSKKKKIISWDLDEDTLDDDNEIVMSLDSSGNKIRKLRRRSKIGNSQSKAYKKITGGSLVLLTSGGILLFGSIAYKGIKTISRDISSPKNINPSNLPNKLFLKPISAFLTIEEKEKCMAIISSFITEQDKIKIKDSIVHPEITMPRILKGFYGPKNETYQGIMDDLKFKVNDKYIILLNVKINDERKSRMFAFEQTQQSLRMNWEVSYGYQILSVDKFIKSKPSEPHEFRASIRLADYYAHHFNDESEWQCLELSFPNTINSKTFAYVYRNSPLGNEIIKKLKPNKSLLSSAQSTKKTLSVIAKLRYQKNSNEDNQVELVEITKDNWY